MLFLKQGNKGRGKRGIQTTGAQDAGEGGRRADSCAGGARAAAWGGAGIVGTPECETEQATKPRY